MVPLQETINITANLLEKNNLLGDVSKETMIELLLLATSNVQILTDDGYYTQIDGVAMGSPLGPYLANVFLAQYDKVIAEKCGGTIYERYVDDILTSMKSEELPVLLQFVNQLHPNLKFTSEVETNNSISFLDLKLVRNLGSIEVSWYRKKTDTNVYLNFYSKCPTLYKKSVVRGAVCRLFHIASSWDVFHNNLTELQLLLEANQYPPSFYHPLVRKTLDNLITAKTSVPDNQNSVEHKAKPRFLFIEYRGTDTDNFVTQMKKLDNSPKFTVIQTTRKLRTMMPSLKAPIPAKLQSNVVYETTCPGCNAQYIGQTKRHLATRLTEHSRIGAPLGDHFRECIGSTSAIPSSTKIIDRNSSDACLLLLEAIHISQKRPALNAREEFRQRHLALRF